MDAKETFEVQGYYCNCCKRHLPDSRGIYFVFSTKCKLCVDNTVEIHKLLYIGEAHDQTIQHRLFTHEKQEDFERALKGHEGLCFSAIILDDYSDDNIKKIENALIYAMRPPINIDGKESFNHHPFEITLTGDRLSGLPFTHFKIDEHKNVTKLK